MNGEIDMRTQNSFCLFRTKLSGYCQVSSRSTARVFYDAQNFPQGNTQMLRIQGRVIVSNLELTWQYPLSEFCLK